MTFFSTVREIAEGFKLSARYTFADKHNMIEKGVQPRISRNNTEGYGR